MAYKISSLVIIISFFIVISILIFSWAGLFSIERATVWILIALLNALATGHHIVRYIIDPSFLLVFFIVINSACVIWAITQI